MTSAWPEVRLGDVVCEAKPGFASGHDLDDGVFQFRMNNLTREGQLDLSKRRRVPRDSKKIETFLLGPGDVLFNATNSPELVGKSAYISDLDEPAVFSNHFVRLRADTRQVEPRFLWRWLQHEWHRGLFRTGARQWVNQATYGREALVELQLPLPPIEEQRRIAAVLDQADELRVKRRASVGLIDSLKESIYLDLADDTWPRTPVGSLAAPRKHAIRTGPFGSQLLHSEFVDEGVAVLGIDNAVQDRFMWAKPRFITAEKFEQLRRYQVHPGDVLITIMGTCGRVAVVPHDVPVAINTKHLCCISLDPQKCLSQFLWAALKYDPGVRHQLGATARGAVMPGLNMGLIKSAEVPLPPLDVQLDFTRRLMGSRQLEDVLTSAAVSGEELFTSLQNKAFAGQL